MNQITFYLEKFKNLEPYDAKIKRSLQEAFKSILNIELSRDDIHISKGAIFVKVSPIMKSEAMIHQEEITALISHSIDLR